LVAICQIPACVAGHTSKRAWAKGRNQFGGSAWPNWDDSDEAVLDRSRLGPTPARLRITIDHSRQMPVPKNDPEFFTAAIAKARAAGKPIVIDFWAEWSGPCKQPKKITLAETKVAKALEGVELIFVDLTSTRSLPKPSE